MRGSALLGPPQELKCCSVGGWGVAGVFLFRWLDEGQGWCQELIPGTEELILSADHAGLSGNKVWMNDTGFSDRWYVKYPPSPRNIALLIMAPDVI